MNHAVSAAREHEVGVVQTNHLGRFAKGLGAGGARGQAVVVGSLQIEVVGEMARSRVQFLLILATCMKILQSPFDENRRIDLVLVRVVTLSNERDEVVKILNAFAGAQIHAESCSI